MAAYRRVDDCGLTACTPGSALGLTLGIEYGKAFTFSSSALPLLVGSQEGLLARKNLCAI